MRKRRVVFHRADFVNKPGFGEDASIMSQITITERSTLSDRPYWDACLKFRDCNSTVNFDVYVSSTEELDNLIHKVELMISHLRDFKEAVKIHGREFVNQEETYQKSKKKKKDEE